MIPVNTPAVSDADIAAVVKQLTSAQISGHVPAIEEFESALATYVGTEGAVAVSSGSAALDLAIELCDLKPGDEVILPTFTIISCLAPVLRRGARPMFVDASPQDWNLDVAMAASLVTQRTRAVIAVHTYGLAADVAALREAVPDSVFIVEDAAESLGVTARDSRCGSLGDVGVHSFYANKVITGGEGGALTTDDPTTIMRLRALRNLDFGRVDRFRHEHAAWNLRLSALQASLAHSQLNRIDDFLTRRHAIGQRYRRLLAGLPRVSFQPTTNNISRNGHWVVALTLADADAVTARKFTSMLASAGVETRPFFSPMHQQPLLARYGMSAQPSLPVAESLAATGFYLPTGNGLALSAVDEVCSIFHNVYQQVLT